MTLPNKKPDSLPKSQIDMGMPQLTPQEQIDALSKKIDDLIRSHTHDGSGAARINLNTDILGLFETVSSVPSGTPRDVYDQVKIYVNSTTYRLYWYDATGHVWHYVTATA